VTRSIHETRRVLEDAQRWDYGNRRQHEEAVGLIEDRLAQKRRLKRRTERSRSQGQVSATPVPLQITTERIAAYVHHPLSEEDIRALLALFPADVRPLVQRVHRRAGFLEDDMREDEATPDPLTGRHGFEVPGDIWMPRLRGRFRSDPFEIDLFAYVYDEAALRVPEVQTTILWLEQALTFAHEVAHAWDRSGRTARDRWALDESERAETYAEETARIWAKTVATDYFEEAHPVSARAFDDWIVAQVGIPIPLARVCEDLDRSIWGVDKGLLEICANWDNVDELDARVEIAEQFHFVDGYDEAREILRTVLARDADHVPATILMGDIAVHEDRWPDALQWTAKALALAPNELDAHEDRVDALIGAKDWRAAVEACDAALELLSDRREAKHSGLRLERARCLMELGAFGLAGEDLDQVITHGLPPTRQGRAGAPRRMAGKTATVGGGARRGDCWIGGVALPLAEGVPHGRLMGCKQASRGGPADGSPDCASRRAAALAW
jgi:tetratricopeptide (TPR) repeat protein